jgi:hypothetical protein
MIVLQGTGWKMMIPDESITDIKPLAGPYPRIGFLVENNPIQFIKHFETEEERDAAVERIRAARAQKVQADSNMNAEAARALEMAKERTEIELDRMREQQREEQEHREKKRRQRAAERRKAEQEKPRADVRPITLKDGVKWKPTQEDFDDWLRMFPDVDVKREFDNMRRYCLDKPQKRKTARGIKRFVTNWLERTSKDQKEETTGRKRTGWTQGMEQQDYDIDAIERDLLAEGQNND